MTTPRFVLILKPVQYCNQSRMRTFQILTFFFLILNPTAFSHFIQDINQFDNCNILLYTIGPITSRFLDPLPHAKHPLQLAQPSALIDPSFVQIITHKGKSWLNISSLNLSYPSVLPDIQPTLSKSPLTCKLFAVLVTAPRSMINLYNMNHLFGALQTSRETYLGLETEDARLEHNYKFYFRHTLALVYLPDKTAGFLRVNISDVALVRLDSVRVWNRDIVDKYHIRGTIFVKYFKEYENLKLETALISKINSLLQQSLRNKGSCRFEYFSAKKLFKEPFTFQSLIHLKEGLALHRKNAFATVMASLIKSHLNLTEVPGHKCNKEHDLFTEFMSRAVIPAKIGDDLTDFDALPVGIPDQSLYHLFWINESISFVTCSPTESFIKFANLLTPYESTAWVAISVTFLVLAIVLNFATKNFAGVISLLSVVLENSSENGASSRTATGLLVLWTFVLLLLGKFPNSLKSMVDNDFLFVDVHPFGLEEGQHSDLFSRVFLTFLHMVHPAIVRRNLGNSSGVYEGNTIEDILYYRWCFYDYERRRRHSREAECSRRKFNFTGIENIQFYETYLKKYPILLMSLHLQTYTNQKVRLL